MTSESDSVLAAVSERLRFFLSDANIRQDTFLRKFLLRNNGSYPHQVTIETLLKFNTIKQHTTDPAVIVQAAKSMADAFTVSEDEKAIGRVKPFAKEDMDGNVPLSLFVQNLPLDQENKQYGVTADELRDTFEAYGPVALVKLRYRSLDGEHRKAPAGSALIEFEKVESLEKAAAELTGSNAKKLTLKGKDLEMVTLQGHIADKAKAQIVVTPSGENKRDLEDQDEAPKEFTLDWKKGCVIKLTGLASSADREAILKALSSGLGTTDTEVKERKFYADFSRGQTDGAIRCGTEPEAAELLCKKLVSGELRIAGAPVDKAVVLDGEEEETYWKDFIAFKNKQMVQKNDERASGKRQKRR